MPRGTVTSRRGRWCRHVRDDASGGRALHPVRHRAVLLSPVDEQDAKRTAGFLVRSRRPQHLLSRSVGGRGATTRVKRPCFVAWSWEFLSAFGSDKFSNSRRVCALEHREHRRKLG